MGYFDDVYERRLNRYGDNPQDRIKNARIAAFNRQLLTSPYRVDFEWEFDWEDAELVPYKQDRTQTLMRLLTRKEIEIPNGTIIPIVRDGQTDHWMVYWLEDSIQRGYNRYVVLRMTHFLTWKSREGEEYSTWAYMYGPGSSAIFSSEQQKTGMPLYSEDNKSRFFITGYHESIARDIYFTVTFRNTTEGYKVTGYDMLSTPGVEYVTVNYEYLHDESPEPTKMDKLYREPLDGTSEVIAEGGPVKKPAEDTDLYWFTGDKDDAST